MAGLLDFEIYEDDFVGTSVTLPASANIGTPWLIVDTSSAGTPTYVRAGSAATLTLAATSEVENVCLAHGDSLAFDIDDIPFVASNGVPFVNIPRSWLSWFDVVMDGKSVGNSPNPLLPVLEFIT